MAFLKEFKTAGHWPKAKRDMLKCQQKKSERNLDFIARFKKLADSIDSHPTRW